MSDREALKIFSRQPVLAEMVEFLVSTTNSVIQVKPRGRSHVGNMVVTPVACVSLAKFITTLIDYLNVQTPTLMAALVYLNRLRNVLPGNAVGMETTRHRIFLASLILSAKSLNDSSPLNKHWTKYTNGLMTNVDVNLAERELIGLLNWNLTVSHDELVAILQPFLVPIKNAIQERLHPAVLAKLEHYRLSSVHSTNLLMSRASSRSIFSNSSYLLYSTASLDSERMPLAERSMSSLNNIKAGIKSLEKHLAPPTRVW